jgi:hypothetical protein
MPAPTISACSWFSLGVTASLALLNTLSGSELIAGILNKSIAIRAGQGHCWRLLCKYWIGFMNFLSVCKVVAYHLFSSSGAASIIISSSPSPNMPLSRYVSRPLNSFCYFTSLAFFCCSIFLASLRSLFLYIAYSFSAKASAFWIYLSLFSYFFLIYCILYFG